MYSGRDGGDGARAPAGHIPPSCAHPSILTHPCLLQETILGPHLPVTPHPTIWCLAIHCLEFLLCHLLKFKSLVKLQAPRERAHLCYLSQALSARLLQHVCVAAGPCSGCLWTDLLPWPLCPQGSRWH